MKTRTKDGKTEYWDPCEWCDQTGYVQEIPYSEMGHSSFSTVCSFCGGHGGYWSEFVKIDEIGD